MAESEVKRGECVKIPLFAKLIISLFLIFLLFPTYQYHQATQWGRVNMETINQEGGQLAPGYWLQGDQ